MLGGAEAIPFPDGTFDAVIVSDAFHHFPDQETSAREIRRVLRPGGGVMLLEFDRRAWPVAAVEHMVDHHGHLFAPGEMCEFMHAHGIDGTCRPTSWMTYDFVGSVAGPAPNTMGATD